MQSMLRWRWREERGKEGGALKSGENLVEGGRKGSSEIEKVGKRGTGRELENK